jgi:hypothetical protein
MTGVEWDRMVQGGHERSRHKRLREDTGRRGGLPMGPHNSGMAVVAVDVGTVHSMDLSGWQEWG